MEDGMEADVKGDEKQEEFGHDATPVDSQSRPWVVCDVPASVEIIEKVSPSKFPTGRRLRKLAAAKQSVNIRRRDRKAAAAITTPYNVGGLRKKLQRTLPGPSSTVKFDPYRPVPTRLVRRFDQFIQSGRAANVDLDILFADKDFFQLLITSESG